ncbi:hypothetical protein [Constantimarinum furrinae]|uniref:Uncharacterized protein n=1 Tax=Constantimarinum furrinae TaxID=2562285 RepID=A0A7G8PS61_9FLAO|nr:hypothetical protein [Constantimarinum furrinae]QNJ97177.1 hypothetical protein ALE3EI_0599 [Constantimarinum furrinae]
MKKFGFLVFMGLLATSCQFFETERISTETFYEEEVKAINWKDVDQYPTFPDCEEMTEKAEQKYCFEHTLTAHLYHTLSRRNITARQDLNDTIELDFTVDKSAQLFITNIAIDSLVIDQFPDLENWLYSSVDSLQPLAPAYKRGIPVRTTFRLPIVIATTDL